MLPDVEPCRLCGVEVPQGRPRRGRKRLYCPPCRHAVDLQHKAAWRHLNRPTTRNERTTP